MKSKNSPGRRVRREQDGATPAHRPAPDRDAQAVILDFVQSRIEAFNQQHGGGVFVRKDAKGYTLIREDSGRPVARLRPKDQGRFEILYWNPFHDRWRSVGAFGGTILSLEDALEFVADDPMDCFWH
jgi:hypothetical protein